MYVSTSTSTATWTTLTSTSTTATTSINFASMGVSASTGVSGEGEGSGPVLLVCGALGAVVVALLALCLLFWTCGWWRPSIEHSHDKDTDEAAKKAGNLPPATDLRTGEALDSSLPRLLGRSSGPGGDITRRLDIEKGLQLNKGSVVSDGDGVPWTSVDTQLSSGSGNSGSRDAAESESTSSNPIASLPNASDNGNSTSNPEV